MEMLCTVYKVNVNQAAIFIFQTRWFSAVPDILMQSFGKPQFLMPFNLRGVNRLFMQIKMRLWEKDYSARILFKCQNKMMACLIVWVRSNKPFIFLKISKSCFISIFSSKTPLELTATFKRRIKWVVSLWQVQILTWVRPPPVAIIQALQAKRACNCGL